MTEFEFSSLHFDDEQMIKEIWTLSTNQKIIAKKVVAFNEPSIESTNESPEHFIRLILGKGGNANETDVFGLTPVHMAARNVGRHAYSILKVLLEEGRGDPNIRNKRIVDPLLDMILPIINLEKLKNSLIN